MNSQTKWPALQGRAGTTVRVIYRLLAVITALYVVVSLPLEGVDLFRNSAAISHYGFAVKRGAQGALPVTAEYPSAVSAGLHEGDSVLALDGVPFSKGATRFDLGARLADLKSAPAKLTVRDVSGVERIISLTPQIGGLGLTHLFYGMPIWAFGVVQLLALAIPLITLLGASFVLYKRRPYDGEAMLLAFSFLALTFSTSSGSWPFIYLHVPDLVPDIIAQAGTALLCMAVAGLPDGRFNSKSSKVALGIAVLYGLGGPFILLADGNSIAIGLLRTLPEYAALLSAVAAITQQFRHSSPLERQQIKCVLAGAVVTLLSLVIPIVLEFLGVGALMAPWLKQVTNLSLFVAFHISIPLGMVISVLAYRLFDSEAVITRSAAYAALSVGLLGIFAASESVLQSLGEKMVSGQLGTFAGVLAAVFTAMFVGPLHARIKRYIERAFRKDLFHMREDLPNLVGDLRETTAVEPLAAAALAQVMTGVRPRHAAILMGTQSVAVSGVDKSGVEDWVSRNMPLSATTLHSVKSDELFSTRVPLSANGIGLVGWLLLSSRPDASLYGKDEKKALKEVADPLARALAVASLRETRSTQHRATETALRSRLEDVEAELGQLKRLHAADL